MSCSAETFSYYCPKQNRQVFFDYYALLNISKDATEEQIKKAYRKFAILYHPDKCNNDKKELSKEKFKIIGDAYQNLLCPVKRSLYNSVLLKMELKQNAKKKNPQGFCSVLQNCSREELIYFLVGSFTCENKPRQQYYDCSQQSNGNYYQQQSKSSQPAFRWDENNNNNNNFECNPQANGFSDDENNSEESEGEPQCQGSDASSNSSEQNFYQKFSFFNNINTKEQLNPENFTLLKGIFNNSNCNQQNNNTCSDEFVQRFKWYQENCKNVKVEQQSSEKCSEQLLQKQENENKGDNNCMAQQNNSTDDIKQYNDMECENQNDDDISLDQKEEESAIIQQNKCKNRLTKAQITQLQKQNHNKKIIERIRNKKPIFSTTICKRIKKQN